MGALDFMKNRPTLADRPRGGWEKPKGEALTRLESKTERRISETSKEKVWRAAVWARDKGCCRWCRRKVVKTISLVPGRAESHHVSGRVVRAIRWLRKNGILLCLECHQKVTGKVAEKWKLVAKKTFVVDGVAYADADHPVTFQRAA